MVIYAKKRPFLRYCALLLDTRASPESADERLSNTKQQAPGMLPAIFIGQISRVDFQWRLSLQQL